MIDPSIGFAGSLILTLLFLGLAVNTGLQAKRAKHFFAVGASVLMLVATIYFALGLGELYDLEAAGWITPVHMKMARVNTAAYLLPVATGIATLRNPRRRKLHGRVAFLILFFTICTAATGTLMLLWSTPLETVAP